MEIKPYAGLKFNFPKHQTGSWKMEIGNQSWEMERKNFSRKNWGFLPKGGNPFNPNPGIKCPKNLN